MSDLAPLINDLALIISTAAVVTLIFKKLKQPVVLGYLVAGLLVSSSFELLPNVQDTDNIKVWADIGVIFMIFCLGLEFSFTKLAKIGVSASITATFEITTMLILGYLTGRLLGWSKMDALFLGGIIAISSTTIIMKAFDELALKAQAFASLVFGVLIVEDLITVLLLVLLSSVAVSQTLAGGELVASSLKLGFFLVLWFILGIYLLPAFLRRIRLYLNQETLLLISIGLCLMMAMTATRMKFSPALGAFVMGSLLAETPQGPNIVKLVAPIKDLFSAVFFVSVGMLFKPQVLVEHYGAILVISAVLVCGKIFGNVIGALLSGRNLNTAIHTGMSLAQIGEFSFIIASIGMSYKVTSDFLYPIAIAVSVLTTFTTPYLIRASDKIVVLVGRWIPVEIKDSAPRAEHVSTNSDSLLAIFWRNYGVKTILNIVVIIAITQGIVLFAMPALEKHLSASLLNLLACTATFLICAPFIWALVGGMQNNSDEPITVRRQVEILIVRWIIAAALMGLVLSKFTSMFTLVGVVFVLFTAGAFFFTRFPQKVYENIERRFIFNLKGGQEDEGQDH